MKVSVHPGYRSRAAARRAGLWRRGHSADGTLGTRPAALLEPYADSPFYAGELSFQQAEVDDLVAAAGRARLQVEFHVIGDQAIEQALVAFQKAARSAARA